MSSKEFEAKTIKGFLVNLASEPQQKEKRFRKEF